MSRLTYRGLMPSSTIIIPAKAWPPDNLRTLQTVPTPARGYIGLAVTAFPAACRRIGLDPDRVDLKPTSYDCVYLADLTRAWYPPAALVRLNRLCRPETDQWGPNAAVNEEASARRQLDAALATVRDSEARLRQLSTVTDEEVKCGIEFDRLMANPDIESITIDGMGNIAVETKTLYVEHDGTTYELGRIRFTFSVERDGYVPTFRNLDHRPDGFYDHPNVKHGTPCLGNARPDLQRLHGQGNFDLFIALCIQYLKSFNPDDKYRGIWFWPEKRRMR